MGWSNLGFRISVTGSLNCTRYYNRTARATEYTLDINEGNPLKGLKMALQRIFCV